MMDTEKSRRQVTKVSELVLFTVEQVCVVTKLAPEDIEKHLGPPEETPTGKRWRLSDLERYYEIMRTAQKRKERRRR